MERDLLYRETLRLQDNAGPSEIEPGREYEHFIKDLSSYKNAWELAQLALAIGKGERDENQLTNQVFFGRHPELNGRKLRKEETALVKEWLGIRDQVVRPLLQSLLNPAKGTQRDDPGPFSGIFGGIGLGVNKNLTISKILEAVKTSGLVDYRWRDRGKAPIGYLKGMALTYARVYCKYAINPGDPEHWRDRFTVVMARGITKDASKITDAIAGYADKFKEFGADVSTDGVHVLRGIFTILLGLGMRESSGKHCTGWDRGKLTGWGNRAKAVTPSPTNSEAGLFQMSYDIGMHKGDFKSLYEKYQERPKSGLLEYFREGVRCTASNLENYGTGVGADFQKFSKECPAFTVELAALALRTRANHWGPIRKNTAEILPESWGLFKNIERIIDTYGGCRGGF